MVVERGYEQQVSARAQDVAVQTSPDQFGAGLGRAMGELGQTMNRAELQAYQVERQARTDSEAADFARRFAEARMGFDETVRNTRAAAAPGGAGHRETIKAAFDKSREALLAGITEERVRNTALQQISGYEASLIERESVWQEGRRVAKVVTDVQTLSDIGANRVRQLSDQGAYQEEVKAGYAFVDSLNVDDDTKAKLRREMVDQKYAVAFLNGMNDKDPVAARAVMDAGTFNEILEPAQLEQLRSGADVEIRRAAAVIEHEANMQKAGVREQFATLEEMDRQGFEIAPEQFKQVRDAMLAMGDTSAALKIDGMMANNAYAKIYRGATPVQREARVAALSGKDKRTATEQRELEWLRNHAGPLDQEFNSDPVGYAAKYGTGSSVPPPIDPADPQSVAARLQWRKQYAAATGRPVPVFSDNELLPLRERVQSGAQGRLEVLRALDAMPSADRAVAAGQIVPGDTGFRHEALIQPFARATVYAGREKLASDRTFLNPDRKTPQGVRAQQLLNISGSEIDQALRGMQPAEAAAVKEIAGQWLAGWLSAKGRDVNSITPGDIRNAATAALGGQSKNGTYLGGIGHWAGGQPYLVPDGFNQPGFQNYAARQRMADDKKGAGPVDENGQPFDLNRAYPVFIGAGRYRWETPGGSVVLDAKRQIYTTRIGGGK
ncbi:MAG: hypothetical protein B7Y36_08210 [Novosphingobium sp. 28-62-57]|uniref:hypothetical protein n=1 Tax=unclassified Novosphingobium TaxID=2644732 RepID=UPI000BCD70D4|nr:MULTISPECIES: hypothetical protein [unclassified Novosphingobium]OYW47908.1 MAG: hypothetical protein B7Z36_01305 [Novosphingobium sp. 12-63-9]OYZ10799.1 MAG: hypothetical protein B7Y36_08210 [Novosphingobium sp. 28-62-57]OZA30198.1 MAG: hypothetical protein B7X92_16295 [Novosphingobium sp. 17-62-9]HQS69746.1 hypothetical protein [Novosphingobium sp.]